MVSLSQHRILFPSNAASAPRCTPLYNRTTFLDCDPPTGCQLLSSPAPRFPYLLFCIVAVPLHASRIPGVSSLLRLRSLPVISVLGCAIFISSKLPPEYHSASHRCVLAPNVRTHPGQFPPAIPTTTLGFLWPLSPFRLPETYLSFRGSLFPTRRRNRGSFSYGLRLSLPRVPLLLILMRTLTLTWRRQGSMTYGTLAKRRCRMSSGSPILGVGGDPFSKPSQEDFHTSHPDPGVAPTITHLNPESSARWPFCVEWRQVYVAGIVLSRRCCLPRYRRWWTHPSEISLVGSSRGLTAGRTWKASCRRPCPV